MKKIRLGLTVVAILWLAFTDILVWGQPIEVSRTVENVIGHRKRFDNAVVDAVQSYLLIDVSVVDIIPNGIGDGIKDINPKGILVLLPGGPGTLAIADQQVLAANPFFSLRTRYLWAAKDYVVAIVDAASDFLTLPGGLIGHAVPGIGQGDSRLKDIDAVMRDLRGRFPGLPLWAIGLSLGAVSAGAAAAELAEPPDGLVLLSPATGPIPGGQDMRSVDLESVTAPTLIVTNLEDHCPVSKPVDAKALRDRLVASPKVKVLEIVGSSRFLESACVALNPHTFLGVEQTVIDKVTAWIEKQ